MSTLFQQAFERLLRSAPGPVFPRARSLYFKKFSLEPVEESAVAGALRTFLLLERIEEAPGALRVIGERFAVVHWQGSALPLEAYAAYLGERWDLCPADLVVVEGEEWFRQGGAFATFSATVLYERQLPQLPS